MRYRVKDYTINVQHNAIILDIAGLTVEDVRLIVNETQNKVICSSMQKANITIAGSVVATKTGFEVPTTVCTLVATDKLTIEIDRGEAPSSGDNVAKQGSNPNATLTDVQQRIENMTNYATTDEVDEMLEDILIPYNE